MSHRKSGYIFIVTLIILASITLVITYITTQSDAFVQYARVTVDHQKARAVAMAGVHLAMSHLADGLANTKNEERATKETEQGLDKRLLRTLLPIHGHLQTYILRRDPDGINGKIQFCITSEDSKIDLNAIYDRSTKKFIGEGQKEGDYKKFMEQFLQSVESHAQAKDLFAPYAAFMQQQQTVLNDVTQLLSIKQFTRFGDSIFYEPTESSKDRQDRKNRLYLQDMFSVWSGKRTLDPWLLTDSMCTVLGLTRNNDNKTYEAALSQQLPETFAWEKDWDTYLAPVYGKKYADLPPYVRPLFAIKFEPKIFSVLSYGKIGRVTQKVLAIVESQVMNTQKKQKKYSASIRTVYWL